MNKKKTQSKFLLAASVPLGIRRSLLCYLPVLICRDVFTPIWWGSFFRLLSVPNSEMKDRTSVPLCSSPTVREQSYFRTITKWLEITHDYQALKAILPPLSDIRIKAEKSSELAKRALAPVCWFLALAFTVFSLVFLWSNPCTSFQSIPLTEWAKLQSNPMQRSCWDPGCYFANLDFCFPSTLPAFCCCWWSWRPRTELQDKYSCLYNSQKFRQRNGRFNATPCLTGWLLMRRAEPSWRHPLVCKYLFWSREVG